MKKILLILLSIMTASLLFAAVATLDTPNADVSFFNANGYRESMSSLGDGCTAVTGADKATFSTDFGIFTLDSKTAVRFGSENNAPYIYLIKGNVELNNTSVSAVTLKTPESIITLPGGGFITVASDLTNETATVLHATATKTDILTGTVSVIPDSYVAPIPVIEQPVIQEPVTSVEPVEEPAPVEETPVTEPVQEPVTEPVTEPAPVEEAPAAEPVAEPVTEPVEETAPVEETSAAEPVTEPVQEATPAEETPAVTETVTGKGFSFGLRLHGDIRDVRLDTSNQYFVTQLRNAIESDSNWYASFYAAYNSLKISLRAERTNINPANYKFDTTKNLVPQIMKLASSFVDEIKYGSEGTLFSFKMDRNSDVHFKNTAFGQMEHDYVQRGELGLYTAVKTDYIAAGLFIDNLSLSDAANFKYRTTSTKYSVTDLNNNLYSTYRNYSVPGINSGIRVSAYVTKSKKITVGLSALAMTDFDDTNNDFKPVELLPGADLTFNIYGNSKSKLDISVSAVVDATKSFKNYAGGLCLSFQAGAFTADLGADYTHGAFLSRIVDYNNKAYDIATDTLNAEHVVNAYADLNVKFNKLYAGFTFNVPFNLMPFGLYDAPVQDTTLKLGAELGKVKLHAAAKFSDLVENVKKLTTKDGIISYLNDNTERLAVGADFDLGVSTLNVEANYLNLTDSNIIPLSLSLGLTIKYDSKLFD